MCFEAFTLSLLFFCDRLVIPHDFQSILKQNIELILCLVLYGIKSYCFLVFICFFKLSMLTVWSM